MIASIWMLVARIRMRVRQRLRPPTSQEDWVSRYASGRSFLDVGCMWNAHGRIGFAAEQAGATSVTGLDLMAATPEYEAEHARRGSAMRLLSGDLHDPAVIERAGAHDVVWCSGVLYHAPHPLLTLRRLRAVTHDVLILATETIPEIPGYRGACVFYPGLPARRRRVFASGRPGRLIGLTEPYDPALEYENWFWGISPSALRAMVAAAGFSIVDEEVLPFHTTLVARAAPVAFYSTP